jgi:hypothetical protein
MKERFGKSKEDLDKSDLTLSDLVGDKKLTKGEVRALSSIELLSIPFDDKKILFGAYIFLDKGIFRSKEILGFSPNQAVDTRDKVRTNTKYEKLWDKVEFLMQPNYLEIAEYKKKEFSHEQIAEVLGIEKKQVNLISSQLILIGGIKPSNKGRGQAKAFEKRVEEILPLRDLLTVSEISAQTGYPKEYFKRLLNVNQIAPRNKREIVESMPQHERYKKIRNGVRKLRRNTNTRYTQQEIADILSKDLGFEVTKQQVKRQTRVLLKDQQVTRRINQIK